MAVIVALLLLQDLDGKLAEIVKRLESTELTEREAAQKDLAAFCREHGKAGIDAAKRAVESAPAEARAHLKARIEHAGRVDALRKELSIFDACELPDVRGKKFVVYNTGAASWTDASLWFQYATGWIIEESRESIVLAEITLAVTTHGRSAALPSAWDRFKDKHPKDAPLPGAYREIDFASFCGTFRAKRDFGDLDHFARGGLSHGVEPALYAHWALQLGRDDLAFPLVELSRHAAAERKVALDTLLLESIAGNTRYQAITGANEGRPRTELLKLWKRIAAFPANEFSKQAPGMVADYESLLKEDATWKEPADVDALKPAERAAYWAFKLRDCSTRQMAQPGSCHVLHDRGDGVNPAKRLRELGWDAIPALIDKLDDTRPTRALGFWRNFAPDSYHLLSHAVAAAQILHELTGVELTARDAREWWKTRQDLGAEAYYVGRLRLDPSFAAARLVELNAAKHLPTLVDRAKKTVVDRAAILPHIAPHLEKKHQILLEEWLRDADMRVVLLSARALLEKCGTDTGARRLIDRLKTATQEDIDRHTFFDTACFDFLKSLPEDLRFEAVRACIGRDVDNLRERAIRLAATVRRRESADLVVLLLDDPDVGEDAARALSEMLLLDPGTDVKAWWSKNGAAVDWAEVRGRAERKK